MRPSDFEDDAFANSAWPRIDAVAGVTEGLGTEIHVMFTIDAPPVEHDAITSAATDGGEADETTVSALTGGRTLPMRIKQDISDKVTGKS